jgi:hypothetical protein
VKSVLLHPTGIFNIFDYKIASILKKIIIILLFVFFTLPIHSQELLPFVENYSKSNFEGDNQIWNVANLMYRFLFAYPLNLFCN